jgi:hypothetical protein
MSSKQNKFARFGLATKGLVYFLIGGLTAFSAFGWGGEESGSGNAIDFLSQQIFGQVLLIITAIGLLGYLFFRWREALLGSFNDKNAFVAFVTRIAYLGSGLFYGMLAFSAIQKVISAGGSGNSGFGISQALNSEYGVALAIGIGVVLTIKVSYEWYLAFSGSYKEKVSKRELSEKIRQRLLYAGLIGHTARGIVFGVLAFLFYKVAFTRSRGDMGQKEAFSFIADSFGSVVLASISLGIVLYGAFMIMAARYSNIE